MIRNIQPVSQAKYVLLALIGILLLQTAITAHAFGSTSWDDPPLILYARSGGNWTNPNTWTLEDNSPAGIIPGPTDAVIILGATVTILNNNDVSCATLEVKHQGESPGVLNIEDNGKLTVFGKVNVVKNTSNTNQIFLSDNGNLLIEYSEFTPACYLATPDTLTASNITQSSVDLSWDAVLATCLTGYRVYVDPGKTGNYQVDLPASSTSVTINNLSSGSIHTFEVSALGTNNFESNRKKITVNTLPNESPGGVEVLGELKKWHKVTVQFDGPFASEEGNPNPFLDYRLDVTFTHNSTGDSYKVPGYFAADGYAADSSSDSGNKWRVHFAPDKVGTWTYNASFVTGTNVAVNDGTGTPDTTIHGKSGSFEISPTDKTGNDNRAKGRLEYIGEHYLRYAETQEYFLKGGADAPENFLAYEGFDGTQNIDEIEDDYIKSWEPHIQDWHNGDPTWQGGKGKGIIGAINYLASEGMNVFSFLTMNIGGDDRNVFPYLKYNNGSAPQEDRMRFDCSKLDQWEIVFEHADRLGMYLHFKLQETEQDMLLDGGFLGVERKLYYRELMARFGHHLALNWNMGEEFRLWYPNELNDTEQIYLKEYAQYFYDHDPYHHHIVVHSNSNANGKEKLYGKLIGKNSSGEDISKLTGFSLQSKFYNVHEELNIGGSNPP